MDRLFTVQALHLLIELPSLARAHLLRKVSLRTKSRPDFFEAKLRSKLIPLHSISSASLRFVSSLYAQRTLVSCNISVTKNIFGASSSNEFENGLSANEFFLQSILSV